MRAAVLLPAAYLTLAVVVVGLALAEGGDTAVLALLVGLPWNLLFALVLKTTVAEQFGPLTMAATLINAGILYAWGLRRDRTIGG